MTTGKGKEARSGERERKLSVSDSSRVEPVQIGKGQPHWNARNMGMHWNFDSKTPLLPQGREWGGGEPREEEAEKTSTEWQRK